MTPQCGKLTSGWSVWRAAKHFLSCRGIQRDTASQHYRNRGAHFISRNCCTWSFGIYKLWVETTKTEWGREEWECVQVQNKGKSSGRPNPDISVHFILKKEKTRIDQSEWNIAQSDQKGTWVVLWKWWHQCRVIL